MYNKTKWNLPQLFEAARKSSISMSELGRRGGKVSACSKARRKEMIAVDVSDAWWNT